jgi:hypothetical protein
MTNLGKASQQASTPLLAAKKPGEAGIRRAKV